MKLFLPIKFGMAVLAVVFCGCQFAVGQQNGTKTPKQLTVDDFPRTRDITLPDTVFVFTNKKPTFQHKRTTRRVKRIPAKPIVASAKTPTFKFPTDTKSAEEWKQVGVTIWRASPVTSGGTGEVARILTQEGGINKEYIPQRVAAGTIFKSGDQVRLSFESPAAGYLYVFDREIYADGKVGEPVQLFPTMSSRGGNNGIQAGVVVDVPAQSDNAAFFKFGSTNSNWRGELLTIIVSPERLSDVAMMSVPSPVSATMVATLEDKYLRVAEEYEQNGTIGKNYTKVEKDAGAAGTRQLTQGDPYPQTLYRVKARAKEPLLINLSLSVK